jgi:predicted solute-binding protein
VRIRVGHSPDPDDAFMYWALTTDAVDTRGYEFEQVLSDIQTLNQWARAARLEVTAISLAAYPFVQQDYILLPHGASIGSGYGPVVVAREPLTRDELARCEIVVPGAMTTSFLALRLVLGELRYRELPFDEIPDEVASGRADAGLLIHEGQLTFEDYGLVKVLDLGDGGCSRPGSRSHSVSTSFAAILETTCSATSRRCFARRSGAGSTTAPRLSSTRSSSVAESMPRSPTASSRCT